MNEFSIIFNIHLKVQACFQKLSRAEEIKKYFLKKFFNV